MSKSNLYALIGLVLIIGVLVFGWISFMGSIPDRRVPSGSTNPPLTGGRTLVSDSGKVDKVSRDFDVPSGCDRQKLTFDATLIDSSRSGGFVNFRIYKTNGDPGDSALGIFDLEQAKTGSGYWSVSPGSYYVEKSGHNADWSYKVTCQ